ncbi:MAG: hypothetical protein Q8M88_11500 [Phenylobacterium sp.]|uniref:hypothetical protein n=1 Tax=Phenylobacterium sp. TaxID=1871053 RepID=UPI0027329527|nr:hypothetical protein [Phenylobacterium sp.]MDP3175046.1 hypothetical protein [Phenylobacterium sp.]
MSQRVAVSDSSARGAGGARRRGFWFRDFRIRRGRVRVFDTGADLALTALSWRDKLRSTELLAAALARLLERSRTPPHWRGSSRAV